MTSRDFHLHPLDPGLEPAQLLALKHMDFWVCQKQSAPAPGWYRPLATNGPYLLATIVELSSVKQHTLMGKVTDEYDVLYRTSIGHHEA